MRMELIQPFIDAADAVFAESLEAPTKIGEVSMDEQAYRRKGIAAHIVIKGEIEGRVILDLAPDVAIKVASLLAGSAVPESEQLARETVLEIANMIIGNSVTLLNDQGFRFKVSPPEIHVDDQGFSGSTDTETMVISIETPCGTAYLNISMHYLHRRRKERNTAAVVE